MRDHATLNLSILYQLSDVSVVVPHINRDKRRLKWFLPQYVKVTPPEVVANTHLAYDPGDKETEALLDQYGINRHPVEKSWITNKLEEAYKHVKTRLCVKLNNDTAFFRKDWAQTLVDQFNSRDEFQMIGRLIDSGYMNPDFTIDYYKNKPFFNTFKNNINILTNPEGSPIYATEYLHAHFVASQTMVLRELHKELMELDNNRYIPDDVLLSFIGMLHKIRIIDWRNSSYYFRHVGPHRGDFTEEELKQVEEVSRVETNDSDIKPEFLVRGYEVIHN